MRIRTGVIVVVAMVTGATFAVQRAAAQASAPASASSAKTAAKAGAARAAASAPAKDVTASQAIKNAQNALGMLRLVTEVDAINTMQFWGTSAPGAAKVDYYGAFGYNPAGMRLEMTRTTPKKDVIVEEVNDQYSWDASEIGAGLDGTGTVTPRAAAYGERMLRLWTLPYGALKAAVAAGDKATLSKENGAEVITFPLSGKFEGVIESITLDSKNLVAKVETRTSDPARADLITEADYSDYADLGDIKSDVMFPGHIVRKQGGKVILDLHVTKVDPNNPYVVFPTPDKVQQAAN